MTRWLKALAAVVIALPLVSWYADRFAPDAFADRDGSGNYTVPNTFTAGSTITAAGHNQNWTDIGAEMTNSLPRDGQAAMTGQFKAADGSLSAPGISFSNDTNTGFYPSASDTIAVVVGGANVGEFDSGGFNGSISGIPPPGVIFPYGGTTEPSGYLFCYGQAVSRVTYADLFTVIGTTYGVGDGATTFNLPDLRGRVAVGQDDMGGSSANRLTGLTNGVNGDTLAATGGLESFTLATANLPTHSHSITDPGHTHSFGFTFEADDAQGNGGQTVVETIAMGTSLSDDLSGTSGSNTTGVTAGNTGSGTAMRHIQPSLIVNYIIKI